MAALLLPPTTQEARAQALTGSIVGNVTDSSGGSIPYAAVTITETGAEQVRAGTTNATGSYDFDAVQPGSCPAHLEREAIGLLLGKRCGESVDLQHEPVGLLPDQQILKRPRRFGNGHTASKAFTAVCSWYLTTQEEP